MNAFVPGHLLALLMLAFFFAPATAIGRQADEEAAAAKTAPVITVVGVNGAAELVRSDGSRSELTTDSAVSFGDAIVTDGSARAALSMARGSEASEDQRDLLLVGPDTRVEVTETGADSPDVAAVLVVVEQGIVRAVHRSAGQASAMDLKTGQRLVHLDRADTLLEYDGASDTALHLVDRGSIMIEDGRRRILLREDMVRSIEEGRVMGARDMDPERWSVLADRTAVEGVEVQAAPAASASEVPSILSSDRSEPKEPVKEDYVYVRMHTSEGDIDLRLDRARAPITVENFMSYIEKDFYEGTIFHRVIEDFMIQGGGFDENLAQKQPDPPITNEWRNGLKNESGTIAMARVGRQPDSATSQFFINVNDNSFLDQPRDGAGYTVFGKVVGGMDVVEKIRQVETHAATPAHTNVPLEPIVIKGVEVISEEQVQG